MGGQAREQLPHQSLHRCPMQWQAATDDVIVQLRYHAFACNGHAH